MSPSTEAPSKLEPLDITCTSTDCDNNLHCFRSTKKLLDQNLAGKCRTCHADLIDWKRVQQQDFSDAKNTIQMLQLEYIRHHFWHVQIDERAVNYARRKGSIALHASVEHRIRKAVGTKRAFDGRQTSMTGNPIHYAQHATACCCRKCIAEWHGIPPDQPLTDEQVLYFTELCKLYLSQRLPQLAENPERVPPIRKKKTQREAE